MLVFSNSSGSNLHIVYPEFKGVQPTLRRLVIERDLPRRTAVQQIANIYWEHQQTNNIHTAVAQVFAVEPVTKNFFAAYRQVFAIAENKITGFDDDLEAKRRFAQTLFNRLMFVYFLSRKGWLPFESNPDYLNALWKNYPMAGEENFYTNRLRPLFFAALNNPQSQDLNINGQYLHNIIGDVPFLNGGLFEENELDKRPGVTIPDEAIEHILYGLFDKFNFTVMESTPFDIEVAVDPEMLGKVFEELVNERNKSGAYYTPRPVVSFMCREALKDYLVGSGTGANEEAIAAFVDSRDVSGIVVGTAKRIGAALDDVTVVDPACGSGAFLLGMMQELVDLQTTLYNVGVDVKSLYDLKLHIIERNLYGVDIDNFAVNIAMLRLWLSLAIEYEGKRPEPLPNLSFKIVCGDTLLGPDPSEGAEVQGRLGYDAAAVQKLAGMKANYMRASGGAEKDRLKDEIEETEDSIREALSLASLSEGIVDWRIDFAEVFAKSGFDIAIANPPYVQLQRDAGKLARLYKNVGFKTFARTGDLYQLFYERGCQLLRPSGILAYITSNSWLKAEYGKKTRSYFAEAHTPLALLELGKDVFESAIVDSSVLLLRTGNSSSLDAFPAVDMDRLPSKEIPPEPGLWGHVRVDGESPWSVLSTIEQSVLDKMRAKGTPLKDWGIAIYRGVLTGFNEAFIIDNATKEALVTEDPKSAEILKPVVRGRDIRRWKADWAGYWLIDAHNGYDGVPAVDIDAYGAVKAHLDLYYDQLEKRADKGRTPYHLRNCAYHEEFAREKLFWAGMSPNGRFAFSETELYCNAKGYIMTGHSLKCLLGILNSAIVTWWVRKVARTTGMGLTEWTIATVERLPIPQLSIAEEASFVQLVDGILAADSEAKIHDFKWRIDRFVCALYDLAKEEIATIESQ